VLWSERGWLGRVPATWSHRCGQVAVAGLTALALLVVAMAEDLDRLVGGWHWQSLAFAVLEGGVAVALSLWLVAWFGRRWAQQGRLTKQASRGAYAAYVLHPPVLVMVSLAARTLPPPPEAKFVLVAATGVVAASTVGWAVTRSARIARFV
jgi:glucans biosynthesis protein C